MEQIIIYGAGNTGKSAYYYLKNKYECLFFVDGDKDKWGGQIENLPIKPPEILKENKEIKVIVASMFQNEILEKLQEFGCSKIGVYTQDEKHFLEKNIKEMLDERTIDLGAFLICQKKLACKEMTFMPGGSQILDYMFLKAVVEKYRCKNYLEIGTYIGESINILTDYCEKLYSITAPPLEGGVFNGWVVSISQFTQLQRKACL